MATEETSSAADFLPGRLTLGTLRQAASGCRGCSLYRDATQTVFGEGLKRSRLMLVGEMPGDREDEDGHPFVGPAGRILDQGLEEAGIDRSEAYVTNVVKHFKFERRGKSRLHRTPNASEIRSCLPWLEAELEVVEPEMLVALGATAAKALFGRDYRVTRQRGEFLETALAPQATATIHPSAVLRQRTDEERRAEMERFVEDLRKVERRMNGGG